MSVAVLISLYTSLGEPKVQQHWLYDSVADVDQDIAWVRIGVEYTVNINLMCIGLAYAEQQRGAVDFMPVQRIQISHLETHESINCRERPHSP